MRKEHPRGHMPMDFDGNKLNEALRVRGLTSTHVAQTIGVSVNYFSTMKRRGRITWEIRSLLRNNFGIREEEYLANAVHVNEPPKAEDSGTQDLSKAAWAQHVQQARQRNRREDEQRKQVLCPQSEKVILLRREELKSIVRDAVMDMLKALVGGAASIPPG